MYRTRPWLARDLMTTDVVTVEPSTSFQAVAEALRDHRISAVPVVDESNRVLGVVSEADFEYKEEYRFERHAPRFVLGEERDTRRKAAAVDAAGLMTSPAVTAGPDARPETVARLFHREHIKRVPIVDDDNRLLGIVSRYDLLKLLIREDDDIAREVRERVFRGTLWTDSVTVTVEEGVVMLTGQLEQRSQVAVAVSVTRAIDGVVDVVDRLTYAIDDTKVGGGDDLSFPPRIAGRPRGL